MAGTVFERESADRADVSLMQEIVSRLNELEQRPTSVPVLEADPPTTSSINLWFLYDGRLRGRNPNGGAVLQFQTMTPGATTTTVARPAQAATKMQYLSTWESTWARSYAVNGTQGDNTRILFGADTSGQRRALFGFDVTAIRAALSGATVQRVELSVHLVSTEGGLHAVAFGGHPATTEPATWSDLVVPTDPIVLYISPEDTDFMVVDNWIGTAIRDSVIGSLGVDQTLIGSDVAGYFTAPPNVLMPKLRVTYTK